MRRCVLILLAVLAIGLMADPVSARPVDSVAEGTETEHVEFTSTVEGHALGIAPDGFGTLAELDCRWSLTVQFEGTRIGGFAVVDGRFETFVSTFCDLQMDLLRVRLGVLDNFGEYHHDPDTDESQCVECTLEGFADVKFCDVCNGNWSFDSDHRMDLPAPYVWGDPLPSGCRRLRDDSIDCHLVLDMFIS